MAPLGAWRIFYTSRAITVPHIDPRLLWILYECQVVIIFLAGVFCIILTQCALVCFPMGKSIFLAYIGDAWCFKPAIFCNGAYVDGLEALVFVIACYRAAHRPMVVY